MPRRVAIVGGGVSGLGAAWALSQHPDRFDFRLFEAHEQLGGNAITVDMVQDDGSAIPFDMSVTAFVPSVYHHITLLMERFGIEQIDTRFSYSVKYGGRVYAHDYDSEISQELKAEIAKFQRILRCLHRIGWLTRSQSKLLNAINPFNYISMGSALWLAGFSDDFRFKILKPLFVNFLMAADVLAMPASLFSRYLEFFDIESATPMQTWDQGTRHIYENLTAEFRDKIYLSRPVSRVLRNSSGVVIEDEDGVQEEFDDVILACNGNHALEMLDKPSRLERYILSSLRYDTDLHHRAIVHFDSSVLPDNEVKALSTRSNHIEQYGSSPDNYEITYIMHNQQPWVHGSDKPCLVTYNATSPIDEEKIIKRWSFQHIIHDVRHVALLVFLFRFVQGRRRTWYCGAHTLVNSQETCFVSGLAAARQIGADYPFDDETARRWFNYYGGVLYGSRFRKA